MTWNNDELEAFAASEVIPVLHARADNAERTPLILNEHVYRALRVYLFSRLYITATAVQWESAATGNRAPQWVGVYLRHFPGDPTWPVTPLPTVVPATPGAERAPGAITRLDPWEVYELSRAVRLHPESDAPW